MKPAPQSYVEYDSNNSGGRWWLADEDWKNLEAAGWTVAWKRLEFAYTDKGDHVRNKDGTPKLVPHGKGGGKYSRFSDADDDGRWLGALATAAYKPGATSIRDAAAEWETITGKSATSAGCPCCGQPHRFTLYRNGKYVESGPETSYEAGW